jgi:hypothetical protein
MVEIYNPNSPRITGLEWVPIREVGVQMSRYDTPVELGYTFSLSAPTRANKAMFYIKEFPEDFILYQPYTVNIYPRDTEADTGPIQRVIAKVAETSTITNTGTVSSGAGVRLINTGSIAQALQDPSNDQFMNVATGGNGNFTIKIRFNMAPLANVLTGKRIVGVNFLSALAGSPGVDVLTRADLSPNLSLVLGDNGTIPTGATNTGVPYTNWILPQLWKPGQVNRGALGDTNMHFGTNDVLDTVNIAPWTPVQLARFGSTGVDQLYIQIKNIFVDAADIDLWQFTYMALEILYCEERRVATGSRLFGPLFTNHYTVPPSTSGQNVHLLWYNYNANTVLLYDTSTYSANPILPAGDYSVTLMQSNVGAAFIQSQFAVPPPTLQTARQLYEIPNLKGVQVNHPIPVDDQIVGKTFTKLTTDVLPQLSLWTSGSGAASLISDFHVYGRQTHGEVSTQNVTQGLYNAGSQAFDYVRYYARRFGNTPAPLLLTTPTLTTGSTASVFITPDEFDLLDPIVDGWKEVTLPFAAPVTVSGGSGIFQWTSSTTPIGSRWEVLGASALALSGAPDNNYVPMPFQVPYANTYGGTTYLENWSPGFPPSVVAANDTSSDAVLMLAAKYAAPTLSLSQLNQPVSGIGQNCGINPDGIPTAIAYNQLSWAQSNSMLVDNFTRVNASAWGGQWSAAAGTATYSVDGSQGVVTSGTTTRSLDTITASFTNVEMQALITIPSYTTSAVAGVISRASGSTDNYTHELRVDFTGAMSVAHGVTVAGSFSTLATASIPYRWSATQQFHIKAQVVNSFLRTKIWPVGDDEPSFWQLSTVDTTRTSGNSGVITRSQSVTNFDDFLAQPFNTVGSTYQLERMDAVDTTWRVIMKATNLTVLFFNDFEARVGILSSYRMRLVDQYDFAGTYSSTVTNTIAEPGVSGSMVGSNDEHIMIFSSNERQTGAINLAYSNAWSNDVTEQFSFPESGFTQLQAMYGKDFYTAFRPLERGGEQFSRNVLVQAAAIAAPTLPDFTSLRDMAWDTVSYICVRDGEGNRWFANVQVPSGTVTNRRKLYIASVNVTEVTDVPSQVDP